MHPKNEFKLCIADCVKRLVNSKFVSMSRHCTTHNIIGDYLSKQLVGAKFAQLKSIVDSGLQECVGRQNYGKQDIQVG